MKRITVYLHDNAYNMIKIAAESSGVSMSRFIIRACLWYILDRKTSGHDQ